VRHGGGNFAMWICYRFHSAECQSIFVDSSDTDAGQNGVLSDQCVSPHGGVTFSPDEPEIECQAAQSVSTFELTA
jgi:hypothetical protein